MLIDVADLEKSYRDRQGTHVPVIQGLSLQVAPGEFIAIQGASGSGKSTLLNILGCLDRPDGGTYRIDGEDVGDWPEQRRAALRNRRIGFVFQAFHLLPFLTVEQNIDLPFTYSRDVRRPPPGHVQELLKLVDLEGMAKRHPGELSGGQQQRVAVARALVLGAELILADEPTGNLDTATARGVIDLFQRLVEQGRTVLLVTHDPVISARARRQVVMQEGRISSEPKGGQA